MKCIILAAGYATRLYPLTENFPKPLLKVREKTILDWLVDDLNLNNSIEKYYIVSNHRYAEHFKKWIKGKNMEVLDDGTSTNETRLGALKDIELVLDTYRIDDDVLVMAGDNVLDFSLTKLLEFGKGKSESCVMYYIEPDKEKLKKTGVALIEKETIVSMEEKPAEPKGDAVIPPFYYLKKKDISNLKKAIEEGINTDAPGSFIAWLSEHSTVKAMKMPGRRYDIGNLKSYEEVENNYKGIDYTK